MAITEQRLQCGSYLAGANSRRIRTEIAAINGEGGDLL
jgi:hypothetical protein